jgi:hypothetical protein
MRRPYWTGKACVPTWCVPKTIHRRQQTLAAACRDAGGPERSGYLFFFFSFFAAFFSFIVFAGFFFSSFLVFMPFMMRSRF